MFSFLLSFLHGGRVLVGLEGAQAAVAPGSGELCRRACVGAGARFPSAPELVGEVHHSAEQGSAVVAREFDEAGFLDKATEFDELSCSCPAFLDPVPGVMQGLGAGRAVQRFRMAVSESSCLMPARPAR